MLLVPLTEGTGEVKPNLIFNRAAHSPAWSPDGATIALVSGKDIWAVPVGAAGGAKNLTQGNGNNTAPTWSPARSKARP
jgi:Tol biopolymer transport system component